MIDRVRHRIDNLCQSVGRDPRTVRLIAVSKTKPIEAIDAVAAKGQTCFGENYAQELAVKAAARPELQWVFLGQLQSNKLKTIVQHAMEIQSVGTVKHAQLIARHAMSLGKAPYPIMVCINAGDEPQKAGFSWSAWESTKAELIGLEGLTIRGLMAIPPAQFRDPDPFDGQTPVPEIYQTLRQQASQTGEGLLSLGMSGDMGLALAAGSDILRIGTAIFGPRS